MNSAKNTVVAILLLGVSYGVYQVINAPDTGDPLAGLMKMVEPSGQSSTNTEPGTPAAEKTDDWNASFTPPPALPPLPSQPLNQPPVQNQSSTPANAPAPSFPELPKAQPAVHAGNAGMESGKSLPANSPAKNGSSAPDSGSANLAPIKPRTDGPNTRFGAPVADNQTTATIQAIPNNAYTGTPTTLAPLSETWTAVEQMVEAGKLRDALARLTPYHERTAATSPDRVRLTEWLDALARNVVYSTEHRLDSTPYIVRQGETLDSLAGSWGVPANLIYNINRQRIPNPSELTPGIELKMISGPFRASVSRMEGELTLYVKDLYAGRFALAGDASSVPEGTCRITKKQSFGSPCGEYCLETSMQGLALHAASPGAPPAGTIAFCTADAEDLFGILSEGSELTIR